MSASKGASGDHLYTNGRVDIEPVQQHGIGEQRTSRRLTRLTRMMGRLCSAGSLSSYVAASAASALSIAATAPAAHAQTSLVSACSGVSLPPSVVTDILGPTLVSVGGITQSILNVPLLGLLGVNLNVEDLLADAAAGEPITLQALNTDGTLVGPDDQCINQADGFSLATPGGIAIGGNSITGLGTGTAAFAGGTQSIALGDSALTDDEATRSIAFGSNATVTAGGIDAIALGANSSAEVENSVALGNGSVADRGPLAAYDAFALTAPQVSAGELSVGTDGAERQITHVAAGSAPTDAVNVAQLAAVADASLSYDDDAAARLTLAGAAGTTIGNLADGSVAAGSTEGVNGGQLFATNQLVAANADAIDVNADSITDLAADIDNGAVGLLRYSDAATPTVPNGGTPTNDVALLGVDADAAVGLHNVAAGDLSAGSTDAVNGGQLFAVSDQLDGLSALALQYDGPDLATVTLAGAGGTTLDNVADATLDANSMKGVNGRQLFATNANVTINATAIDDLATSVDNGATGPVRYSDAADPAVPNGGTPSNDVALVGADAAAPVGLHNVADGALEVGSSDAVTGGQLFTVNGRIDTLAAGAVQYDDAARSMLTLGGTGAPAVALTNVADGDVSAGSLDAVNGGQLYTLGTELGALAGNAVQYDGPGQLAVTLGDPATAPVRLSNIAEATLNPNSSDAVAGSQLYATNQQVAANSVAIDGNISAITDIRNNVASGAIGAVRYADAATPATPNGGTPTNDVTLVGADADGRVGLHNVADGAVAAGSSDAVTGGQLFTVNDRIDTLAAGALQYDDATRTMATLGGAGAPAVTLTNVAAGDVSAASTDAVNGGQLYALSTRIGTVAGSAVQYDGPTRTQVTFGDLTTAPVTLANVAGGTLSAGSTEAVNGSQLYDTNQQIAANTTAIDGNSIAISNVMDSVQNGAVGALRYSDAATPAVPNGGTPTNDVTLLGADADAPVGLHNVGEGGVSAGSTDAVNGGQLFAVNDRVNSIASGAVFYDDSTQSSLTLGTPNLSPVLLTNLAPGSLAAGSRDAVTGDQLGTLGDSVASALGGSTYDRTTNSLDVTLSYGGVQYGSVQGALNAIATNGGGGIDYVAVNTSRPDAVATGTDSVAVGPEANATADDSVAIGAGAVADRGAMLNYAAYGLAPLQTSVGEFAVGTAGAERQITHVAAGSAATDAVNVAQLQAVSGALDALNASAVQYDDADQGTLTLGGAAGTRVTNLTAGTVSADSTDAVNGNQLYDTNQQVAQNQAQIADTQSQVDALSDDVANGAAGPVRYASADDPTTPSDTGPTNDLTLVGADDGAPVGLHNVANGVVALGSTDAVNGGQLYAMRRAMQSMAETSIGVDVDEDGNATNTITLVGGDEAAPVTITNVADGRLSADSTDAVNGRQLYQTNQAVRTAQTTANDALALGQNSVQYDDDGSVTFNPEGSAVALHNVAAGVDDNDAVNVAQLNSGLNNAVAQANSYTDERINDVRFDLGRVDRNARAAAAGALAAAGMPQSYEAGRGMIAAGVATYRGESALAFGASQAFDDGHTVVKLGVTYDTGDHVGANAGLGWQF